MSSKLLIVADQQISFVDEAFSVFGQVKVCNGRQITASVISEADILLVRSVTPVNEALLKGSRVRIVGSATSGTDHVDLKYLHDNSIGFAYAPGSNARSVAEYVLSCLYALQETKSVSLNDLTVGIIGCGHVGSTIHGFLKALGVKCLLNDPPLKEKTDDPFYCELDELFQADVISLHVPLTLDGDYPTHYLVDSDFLLRCKPDITLINTSRGGVIDEAALINHINNNEDFTVIFDVWEHEPGINRALLAKTLIGTPHIAGYSLDGKIIATEMLYHAVAEVMNCNIPEWLSPLTTDAPDKIVIESCEDMIQLAVMSTYDVRGDSAALKMLLQQETAQCNDYFDSLRKNYPVRREFTSKTIQLGGQYNVQETVLRNLGFRIKHND